jgi:hypothetical protein
VRIRCLVSVVGRLEGALRRDADVVGLVLGEHGELNAQGVEVQARDLLVQVLGEDVHLAGGVLVGGLVLPQLDLGQGLVGE